MAIEGEGRARTVSCPSCGGVLRFRGATSIVAVCAYCRATLVRDGVKLENIGKQAELLEDDSPIRIGAEGEHRGERFAVVGRIQYRYEAGLWSEWHVLSGNRKSGWLSDANRDYTICYLAPPADVPPFGSLHPGAEVMLFGERYTVTDLEDAEVVAGEGELPFRFAAGWKAPVADLRGAGTRFATIDYSEAVPHIYVGERLPFDTFRFAGLRDPDREGGAQGRALAFKCAGCGAPIEKRVATTKVVACPSCGSVTDVTGTVGEIVQKNEENERAFAPTIPLASVLKWRGNDYEVVGYMRRRILADGAYYEWGEYLLHNVAQGYLWISEYQGHFSVIRAASDMPRVQPPGLMQKAPSATYLGRTFRHFQRSEPWVSYLVGEFNWRVELGEKCVVDDYVAPPLILSCETSGKEINWSLGEYVEPEALWKALGLKTRIPRREGVAPNQPSPHAGRTLGYWVVCLGVLGVAFVMQLGFLARDWGTRPSALTFVATPGETTRLVSPVFNLGGPEGSPVALHTTSSTASSWLDLDMRLVQVASGRSWQVSRHVGYRRIGGEPDGNSDDMAEVRGLPAGEYTLAIEAKGNAYPNPATGSLEKSIRGQVRVYRNGVGWSNFWLLAGFLALWPIVAWARASSFERARWSESDYPPASASASDDDD